jgi:hypothetical protein
MPRKNFHFPYQYFLYGKGGIIAPDVPAKSFQIDLFISWENLLGDLFLDDPSATSDRFGFGNHLSRPAFTIFVFMTSGARSLVIS